MQLIRSVPTAPPADVCREVADWFLHCAQPSMYIQNLAPERGGGRQGTAPAGSHPCLAYSPEPVLAEEDISKAGSLLWNVSAASRTFFKLNASLSQISNSQAFITHVYPEVPLLIAGNTSNLIINKGPRDQILKSTVMFSGFLRWNIVFH